MKTNGTKNEKNGTQNEIKKRNWKKEGRKRIERWMRKG